jgi:hypothetical protein
MDAAGATTITVNTGLFAAGDTVFIQNRGAGVCTVTAGTATVASAGSLALPQNDAGILYFTSASAATFYDFIQVGATSPLTTKGDIYVYGSSDTRLPVGSNDQILVADSNESLGLKWATSSSGGLTLISETVASALSSLSFSTISGSYKQLLLVWGGIRHSTTGSGFDIRLNNNSNSVYACQFSPISGTTISTQFELRTSLTGSDWRPFGLNCNLAALRGDATGYLMIDNYSSSTKAKTYYGQFNFFDNTSGNFRTSNVLTGTFDSTTAVTSIDIFRTAGTATFSNTTDTTIRLYGVA